MIRNTNKNIPVVKIFLIIIISFNFLKEGKYNDLGYLKYVF